MSQKTDKLTTEIDSLGQFGTRLSPQGFGQSELTQISKAGAALRTIINTNSGEDPNRRAARINRASGQFKDTVSKLKEQLTQREMAGRVTLHDQFKDRLGLEPDRYANEIVAAFRNADSSERAQMMAEIAKTGDGRSFAALESAPGFVHGVDKQVMSRYRTVLEENFAPEIAERRDNFMADVDTVQTALSQAAHVAQSAAELDVDDFEQASREMAEAESQLNDATAA